MPQSLSLILMHLIFSTGGRAPLLTQSIRPDLYAYLATVARNAGCECLRVGGTADHVYLAVRLSRTVTIAGLIEKLKTASSRWLKTQSPALKSFTWQNGYGAFSISPSSLPALIRYIDTQEEHHRKQTFEEELNSF